jgi:hypothetical protein
MDKEHQELFDIIFDSKKNIFGIPLTRTAGQRYLLLPVKSWQQHKFWEDVAYEMNAKR